MGMNENYNEGRFWSKVNKTETCWLWTGAIDTQGYGHVQIRGRMYRAHRLARTLMGLENGQETHHLCGVKRCVNPNHTQPITKDEHRQLTFTKTHCKNGHELTPENRVSRGGGQTRCKLCQREANRRSYRRRHGYEQEQA